MNRNQRRVVIIGAIVSAVVLHLTFWEWGYYGELGKPEFSLFTRSCPYTPKTDAAYAFCDGAVTHFGVSARAFGFVGGELWASVFGLIAPLILLCLSLYLHFGNRRVS